MSTVKKIKVTLIKSKFGRLVSHKSCVTGLGLRKIGHTSILEDTPAIRGMINKIQYMVKVENE